MDKALYEEFEAFCKAHGMSKVKPTCSLEESMINIETCSLNYSFTNKYSIIACYLL